MGHPGLSWVGLLFLLALLGVPVTGATLPVLAFLLPGLYGQVLRMLAKVAVPGTGHIGIHLQHRREARKDV